MHKRNYRKVVKKIYISFFYISFQETKKKKKKQQNYRTYTIHSSVNINIVFDS